MDLVLFVRICAVRVFPVVVASDLFVFSLGISSTIMHLPRVVPYGIEYICFFHITLSIKRYLL